MPASREAPFERWRVEVTPLSPVHVGSGQSIDWATLLILKRGDRSEIAEVDPPRVLASVNDEERAQVRAAMAHQSHTKLPNELRRLAARYGAYTRAVPASKEAIERIRASLEQRGGDTQVERMTADSDGRVLLPGSALKGAMRTAWLAHRLGERRLQEVNDRGRDDELQRRLMLKGSRYEQVASSEFPRRDPFRWLQFADAGFDDNSTYVDLVQIVKPRGAEGAQSAGGILMCREVTDSIVHQFADPDAEPPLAIGELRRWVLSDSYAPVPVPTVEQLCGACTAFYRSRMDQELKRFPVSNGVAVQLRAEVDQCTGTTALVRVGRHSHVECVTVPGAGARGGKSRSWVRGEWPMGWVRVSFTPWRKADR